MRITIATLLALTCGASLARASVSTLIDFDELDPPLTTGPNQVALVGDEFPGITITGVNSTLELGNPARGFNSPVNFPAGTDTNVLAAREPSGELGTIQIDFDEPIVEIAADFFDVEADFAVIGFDIDLDGAVDVSFPAAQGNGSLANLSANLPSPSSSIRIDLGTSADGALLDNLSFTTIPEPASLALLGVGGVTLLSRRRA